MRSRLLLILVCTLGLAGVFATASTPASAQSPTPAWYMMDTGPGGSFPPIGPYHSTGANAVVVEGLGSLGCQYNENNIAYYSLVWVDEGYQTVTELSPQSYCGSLSQYETMIYDINAYMENNSSDPGRYWGGFMLDEEPNFEFSAAQLESLNSYVESLMNGDPGVSYVFTEDQPNGWVLATYQAITSGSWVAPQVYSTSMANAVNADCSTYGICINDVTSNADDPYPWDDYAYTTSLINGTPWFTGDWGSGYWSNDFCVPGQNLSC